MHVCSTMHSLHLNTAKIINKMNEENKNNCVLLEYDVNMRVIFLLIYVVFEKNGCLLLEPVTLETKSLGEYFSVLCFQSKTPLHTETQTINVNKSKAAFHKKRQTIHTTHT